MKRWVVRVWAVAFVASGAASAEPVPEPPAPKDANVTAEPDSEERKPELEEGEGDSAAPPPPSEPAAPSQPAPEEGEAAPSQPAAPLELPPASAPNRKPEPKPAAAAPVTKTSSQLDEGADSEETEPPPFEESLGIELMGGVNVRLSDLAAAYERDEPTDIILGLGLWYGPSRKLAFGASYTRSGLGEASARTADQTVAATYDLNVVGLSARFFPVVWEKARLFVGLGVGAAWQNVSANGARRETSTLFPAEPYQCSASGFGFSLGANAGLDYEVEPAMGFLLAVDGAAHRLSGEVLDDCAFGAGGIVTLAARFGFQYRFDLSPENEPAGGRTKSGS